MAIGNVQGLDTILANLNKELSKINGDITNGLVIGMHVIKAQSMMDTPVDTGNLRGSHYLVASNGKKETEGRTFNTKDKSGARVASEHGGHIAQAASDVKSKSIPFVEVGCTAFYAEYVHEDLKASHTKVGYLTKKQKKAGTIAPMVPIGKAKFLEDAIRSGIGQLISTVKRFAQR